jgi:malonyl-CoA O-methyltransferase
MSQRELVKQSFNRARHHYNKHCVLQTEVGSELIRVSNEFCPNPTHIIDIGCGTGIVTAQLANTLAFETFHAIDIADGLLAEATALLSNSGVTVYEADFTTLNVPQQFDLCFANMSLHWSADLLATLQQLNKHLHANGTLAFSMPLQHTFTELAHHFEINEYPDITSVGQSLITAGFTPLHQEQREFSYSFPSTIEALRSIKSVGASHVPHREHKSLRGKSLVINTRITSLTYQIGYFIARSNHVS